MGCGGYNPNSMPLEKEVDMRIVTMTMIVVGLAIGAASVAQVDENQYATGYKAGIAEFKAKGGCVDDITKSDTFNMGHKDGCTAIKRVIRKNLRNRAKLNNIQELLAPTK
jgi:hypothetical protein